MTTYRTLTSILTLGVMVSCGNDNSRDSATNDTAALTSFTLSTEPTTGDISAGNITMGTPTSGMSASDGTTGGMTSSDTSASGTTTTTTTEGMTTSDPRPVNLCKIQTSGDGMGACDKMPPPEAFEPVVEWEWTGPNGSLGSLVTPLVANLTDDNGDGAIDLCDTPDVIVVIRENNATLLHVLDGATGTLHFSAPGFDINSTPAIGDIDNDGLPEIIGGFEKLRTIEHDGTLKWESELLGSNMGAGSVVLADLDNDGDVEIFLGRKLWNHEGILQWEASESGLQRSPTAADLDGDGDLEIVLGYRAYHHDGSIYYEISGYELDQKFPQIANLDNDPDPEVLVSFGKDKGFTVLEHTGEVKYEKGFKTYAAFPATVADFDGDGLSDIGISSHFFYTTRRADGTVIWQVPVEDNSSAAGATAFDFNSDGIFELVYADHKNILVFGEGGQVLMKIPHITGTAHEYPVVADVDNDGSAEIVVVSYPKFIEGGTGPTVRVIGDKANRWPQARRIWNQHTYHVTNVNEDGTIPQYEQPSWKTHNTFRVNSTLGSGGTCEPPTPG